MVWEVITDYQYRLRNSRDVFLIINYGMTVADLNLPGIITMTVTVIDADLIFFWN